MSADDSVILRVGNAVSAIDRDQWDACAGPGNPFVSYDFLSIM